MTPTTADPTDPGACPLCGRVRDGEAVHSSQLAAAIRDGFPVSPGHTLVIPHRHVPNLFDLDRDEQAALMEMVTVVREALDLELHPDGYNVGINVGVAAGQTVPHVHVHVIPRYEGDVPDPRGGIRWIFPQHAQYWQDDPTSGDRTGGAQRGELK